MTDYRAMFDSEYVGSWDLQGNDATVTIAKVTAGSVVGESGRKAKKPIIFFENRDKGLLCNKTNAKTIAAMYGNDTREWVGKRITLFPTQTQMGNETKDCIRIRPRIPADRPMTRANGRATTAAPPEQPALPEPPPDAGDAYEGP